MNMTNDYQYFLERAQAILREFKPAKKRVNIGKLGSLFFVITIVTLVIGLMWKIKILALGSMFFFLIAIVFYLIQGIQDAYNKKENSKMDQFTQGVMIDRIMSEIYPGCKKSMNAAGEIAANSKLFAYNAQSVTSEGTYQFTTPGGNTAFLAHVSVNGKNADQEEVTLESGTLVYLPHVLREPVLEPVMIFYNQAGYDKAQEESIRALGKGTLAQFYHSNNSILGNFFETVLKGQLKKQSVPIPDDEFNTYYQAFSKDSSSGYFVLNKERVEQLKQLHRDFDEWISVSYVLDSCYLLIKAPLNFVVGNASNPVIREDLFHNFYENVSQIDRMVHYLTD